MVKCLLILANYIKVNNDTISTEIAEIFYSTIALERFFWGNGVASYFAYFGKSFLSILVELLLD